MKICFISPEFPPYTWGGAGRYAYDIANGLAEEGLDVHVVAAKTKNAPSHEKKGNLTIHRYNMCLNPLLFHFSSSLIIRKKVNELDKREHFDIFHGTYGHYFLYNKKPLVSTVYHSFTQLSKVRNFNFSGIKKYYSHPYYLILSYFEKNILKKSSKIICISQSTQKSVCEDYGIKKDSVEIIHIGIDFNRFEPIEKEAAKEKLHLSCKMPVIICISALSSPRKRALDAVRALTYIKKDFPDVFLLLVGKDNDGLIPLIRKEVSKLDLQDNVRFAGRVSDDDLVKHYAASDIFLLPSLFEGQGIAPLEAMAMKVPVIATNTSSLPELITHEEDGLLIPIMQPKKIADAVNFLLSDQTFTNKLVDHAFNKVKKEFDIRTTIKKVIQVYEEAYIQNKG